MTLNLTKYDKDSLFKEFEEYLKSKKTEDEPSIPINIFSKKLSPFESVVKYCYENLNLNYAELGRSLKKDRQVIWTTYKRASIKYPGKFSKQDTEIKIPLSELSSKRHSISELVVSYLKDRNLKNSEIAETMKKDQRTVWTLLKRHKTKHGEDQKV